MEDKNINITDLIRRYEQMRYMYKNIYFDADEFALLANYYKVNKNTSEAELVLNLGLRVHPGSSALMAAKAKVMVAAKKYEEAFDYLSTMPADETNVDLLLLKFECLIKLDRIEEADGFLDYIMKGELGKDKFYEFITEVGYLYNDADRFDVSTMLLEKAMKLDPTDMDVLIELAYSYEMTDDNLEKAINITNAMIDLDPYSYDAWMSLGRLYLYNYEYDLSVEAYDFALAIKESDVEALKQKALTYNQEDNFEEELKTLSECIDASPGDISVYDTLLARYEEIDDYWFTDHTEEIVKVLEKKAEQFGPKNLLLKIADLYLSIGKKEEAQEVYDKIPKEDKETLEYYKLKGNLAMCNRDNVTAEAVFQSAMLQFPIDKDILDSLSEIYFEQDEYEKAASYLEQLIEIDSEYLIAEFRLALIRFQIGEKEPFDNILHKLSDEELRIVLQTFTRDRSKNIADFAKLNRDELMTQLDEARVISVQSKNMEY